MTTLACKQVVLGCKSSDRCLHRSLLDSSWSICRRHQRSLNAFLFPTNIKTCSHRSSDPSLTIRLIITGPHSLRLQLSARRVIHLTSTSSTRPWLEDIRILRQPALHIPISLLAYLMIKFCCDMWNIPSPEHQRRPHRKLKHRRSRVPIREPRRLNRWECEQRNPDLRAKAESHH